MSEMHNCSGRLTARLVEQGPQPADGTGIAANRGAERRAPARSSSPVREPARRLSRRRLAELHQRLSERDVAILRQVGELRLMSARQIEAIHFPLSKHASPASSARSARRVLERLTNKRLLARLDRRLGGLEAGSAGYIYTLAPAGQRFLELDQPRRHLHEPNAAHVDHTLAITQLVVDLLLAERRGEVELIDLQAEPDCWRSVPGLGRTVLRPDLFVTVGAGELERRWFVELDRATTHVPALLRKCRLYESYYRSGVEQAAHGVFPRVLWATSSHERAARLAAAVAANPELTSGLFGVVAVEHAIDVLVGGHA